MSLFDGVLESDPAPNICAPGPNLTPYLITIKRASNGENIILCDVTPPPAGAIAEARLMSLPIFTRAEIPAMRQAAAADPRYIDNLIAARRIYGWGGTIKYTGAA